MENKSLIEVFDRIDIIGEIEINLIETEYNYENEIFQKQIHIQAILKDLKASNNIFYFVHVSDIFDDSKINRNKVVNYNFNGLEKVKFEIVEKGKKIVALTYYLVSLNEKILDVLEYLYLGKYNKSFLIEGSIDNLESKKFIDFILNRNGIVFDIKFKINNILDENYFVDSLKFSYGGFDFGSFLFLTLSRG